MPEKLKNVNDLNKYFISIGKANNPPNPNVLNFYLNNNLTLNKFNFYAVNNDNILHIIKNIKSNATGLDDLNITMILLCCPFIVNHITYLINECIERSYFPDLWKQANVIPLPKVHSPTDYRLLRCMSILPAFSKILEKILKAQINKFLNENNILPNKQSKFRGGYDCSTALAEVTDNIFRALDGNKAAILIMLDYTKAFDMVNHTILLSVLNYIGFDISAVYLIKSFLSNRIQRVTIDGLASETENVTVGVPQGSILGLLLYSIYTLNFFRCLSYCDYHMYADDTQLLYVFNPIDVELANIQLNKDLSNLLLVSQNHLLKVNPTKSVALLFGGKDRANLLETLKPNIDNHEIQFKNNVKNLGLIIDSNLRFNEHVTSKLKLGYSALKTLYSHRHFLSQKTRKLLCDSLILSHFNFCDTVYGPCLDSTDVRRIQKLQNCCMRFIFGIRRRERISYKLKELNWLNMAQRRSLHSICFFYKILKTKSPPYLLRRVTYRTDIHHINIRHRYLINIPFHKKELFKRSFSYNIASVINKFKITDFSLSLFSFKKLIKTQLFGQ